MKKRREPEMEESRNKYVFEFHFYDKNSVVELTMTLKTKLVTPKEAGDLLLRSKVKYAGKNRKYVYAVQRDGLYINPKALR